MAIDLPPDAPLWEIVTAVAEREGFAPEETEDVYRDAVAMLAEIDILTRQGGTRPNPDARWP